MSEIKLQHIDRFIDRHGKERNYFRRGRGKRIPLPGRPGSPEFMRAYQRALDANGTEASTERHRGAAGTFDRLVEEYYQSTNFARLADATRSGYTSGIEVLLREEGIGHRLVAQMTREHVDKIIAKRLHKRGKAHRALAMLRILLGFAVERRWRTDNPAAEMKQAKLGSIHTWTEEEIRQFEAKWPQGTMERVAFDLLLHTGQRSGDVREMTSDNVKSDWIIVVQKKTKRNLSIPVHPNLARSLELAPNPGPKHIITNSQGRAFSDSGFRCLFKKAVEAAGLPKRCLPHGLRKAAARRLAEAGCSTKEIQAITGHASLSEVERYTRAADQSALASTAMKRLLRNGG